MHHLVVIAAATRRSFANPWSIVARAAEVSQHCVSCNRLLFSRCSFSRLPRGLDGAKVLYRGTIGVYYIVLVPQFPSRARKSCLGTIYVVLPRSSCRWPDSVQLSIRTTFVAKHAAAGPLKRPKYCDNKAAAAHDRCRCREEFCSILRASGRGQNRQNITSPARVSPGDAPGRGRSLPRAVR